MIFFCDRLAKAELHIHIEGTMSPQQMLFFAERNKIVIPFKSEKEIENSYNSIINYENFRSVYDLVTTVMVTYEDFYDLAFAYYKNSSLQGVLHREIFFDTQTYTQRNIDPAIVINGLYDGLQEAKKLYGGTFGMLHLFLRDLSQDFALKVFHELLPFQDKIIGIGIASVEFGNPPSKFKTLFDLARSHGFHLVAHAGEFSGPDYMWQAIEVLKVERIDHGVRAVEDMMLMQYLQNNQIGLTVCPISNVKLNIYKDLVHHPIKKLLDYGLFVSINSDDPALFNAPISTVFHELIKSKQLSIEDIVTCAKNSFRMAFIDEKQKNLYLSLIDNYIQKGYA